MGLTRDLAIRTRLQHLLRPSGRLSPPRGWDEAAMTEEIQTLARALDAAAPLDIADEWWARFEDELMGSLRARVWPQASEIRAAADRVAKSIRAGFAVVGGTDADAEISYEHLCFFWREHRWIRENLVRPGFLERMVREGLATWGDLRWHGASIPRWALELADIANRDRSQRHMDELHAATAHLREQGAPRGDVRTRFDDSAEFGGAA